MDHGEAKRGLREAKTSLTWILERSRGSLGCTLESPGCTLESPRGPKGGQDEKIIFKGRLFLAVAAVALTFLPVQRPGLRKWCRASGVCPAIRGGLL